MLGEPFLEQLSAVVRSLQEAQGDQLTLDLAVASASEVIAGCEVAGVSLVRSHGVVTLAATDDAARRADAWQVELGEGPAVNARRGGETVYSPDLGADASWQAWGARVADDLGLHSVVSYRLFTSRDTLGTLSLYSRRFDAFDDDDLQNGLALAAHIAMALAAQLRDEQMQTALVNRTVIGQAEGMLMERYGLTADRAFEVLRRISSDSNTKLHRVAEQLVASGALPDHLERHREVSAARGAQRVSAAKGAAAP
jgi:GAF domain-containing protein